jgi:2-polyprenyl-6-methoxyphenol hydroxylase-like FAD-dependent oxidoreductase
MSLHVVVGTGPVGSATAQLLAGSGDQVRVITRSGSGPEGVERDTRHGSATYALRKFRAEAVSVRYTTLVA